MTNINSIAQIITMMIQIVVLIITKKYIYLLITISICGFVRMIISSIYFDRKYPFLKEKADPLDKATMGKIKTNVKGLILNRVGDACIHQTDNIILSSFKGLVSVGLLSNYTMIISRVGEFINVIFTSALPSLGNLVATESKKEQVKKFRIYNFADFWIYGFSSIAFYILLSPTIELWLGRKMIMDEKTVFLMSLNVYLSGQRISFLNFKTACGSFNDDKYIPLIASVINIIVSIWGAIKYGIFGIYLGTIISGLFQSVVRPWIGYKRIAEENAIEYFKQWISYLSVCALATVITRWLVNDLRDNLNIFKYLFMIAIVVLIPNAVFWLFSLRKEEYGYFISKLRERMNKC